MQGAEVLTRFTADTKDFDSKVKGLNTSVGSIAKGVLAATGITKAFSTAWSMVSRNMGTAIDRYDTLTNFSNVMKNLGISTKESQKAIDKIADKLVGLPTTLQDGAMAVQRLTSANGDIKKSTDLFLAMNNAILAGGAPIANQQAALEQLTQAYSKGKMDMMEWRTIQTAMPAQLKQIAQAMGLSAEELGEMMRQGDLTKETIEKFSQTMVDMNQKGLEGFGSLEEQARGATGGIRTAITNMNSRIAAGLAEMIAAVNKGLKEAGLGDIATIFSNVGTSIKNVLVSLAPYITKAVIMLSQFGNWIIKNKDWLEAIIIPLTVFITTFATITKLIAIVKGISAAIGILNAVLLANPIVLVIAAVAALIAIFVLLWNKCEGFRTFITNMFNGIVNFFKNNWQTLLLMLVNPFAGAFKLLYDNCGAFRNFVNNFVNTIVNWFKSIPGKLKSMATGIVNVFKSIPSQMLNVGKNIVNGLWNGISGLKNWVISKVKSLGKSILNGIKSVLGIHSPSTEFAMVGKFSVLGFTNELDKMQKQVQSQIAETFSISPQLSATTGMHYSPNVNVYNNVDVKTDPLGQVVNTIKTYSGGAKNDYCYGAGIK